MNKHIVDPSFFDDAINMYGNLYDSYIVVGVIQNEYGMQKSKFEKIEIFGSLQNQGIKLVQTKSGNYSSNQFKFYCKSLYRLHIGDFIVYNHKLLHIIDVNDYDEYGVREGTLEMTQLNEHQDLNEFIRYLTGDSII